MPTAKHITRALYALVIVGLAIVAGLFISKHAAAADLGGKGGCCSDLEERVAELEATAARKGNRKVSLQLYGQVSETMIWHDIDGLAHKGRPVVATHGGSPNLIGAKGKAKVAGVGEVGYQIELGLTHTLNGDDGGNLDLRYAYWYFKGAPGSLSVGKQSQATHNVFSITTANTTIASKMVTVGSIKTISGGAVDLSFDGDRKNLVRYDTPSFFGVFGSASIANDDEWDAALRWAGEFAGFKAAVGAGYRENGIANDVTLRTMGGSGSVMHAATGLFINAAYAQMQGLSDLGLDPKIVQAQFGVERNFLGIGATTLYGEWGQIRVSGIDSTDFYGAGIVQNISSASMDIGLAWKAFDEDDLGNTATVFGRIKF